MDERLKAFRTTSEITVEEIQQVGSDAMIAAAAKVSVQGMATQVGGALTEKDAGLIRYLMKARHGSPYETGFLTVRVHAPIKVFREWHRHRVWSYNELSGRYASLEPVFYVPPRERPLVRPDGFKAAHPQFDLADDELYAFVVTQLTEGYREAYSRYLSLLDVGCDKGLARDVLGVGIYSSCYCSANPRALMSFLELRTNHPEAQRPSKPLYEIEVAATKLEAIFAKHWPVTYAAWVENGRAAP